MSHTPIPSKRTTKGDAPLESPNLYFYFRFLFFLLVLIFFSFFSWFYTNVYLLLLNNVAIYAFNGYPFKSSDLIKFFSEDVAWFHGKYVPNPTFSEDNLTENEKYNVKLILEEENKR